jgi:hypothetical protein
MPSAGYPSASAGAATLTLAPEDIADSTAALAETYARPDLAGVAIVDGFGVRIVIERGALEVHDGVGPHRRTRRYDKASHGLSRVVILNAAGIVSFDALKWCSSLGIGVLVLGPDGTCQLASTPRMTDDARLRRIQALAPDQSYGLGVARWLISRKVAGQRKVVLSRFGDEETAETLGSLALAAEDVCTIDEVRQLEATAAALYFGSWSGRPETAPHFAPADRRRIPPHWSRFEGRRSVLASSASNRRAERPTNSILNYLFALLEAEAILACQLVLSRRRARPDPLRREGAPVDGTRHHGADPPGRRSLRARPCRRAHVPQGRLRRDPGRPRPPPCAFHPQTERDTPRVAPGARPDRRARRARPRRGHGRQVPSGHPAHGPQRLGRSGRREGPQGGCATKLLSRPLPANGRCPDRWLSRSGPVPTVEKL